MKKLFSRLLVSSEWRILIFFSHITEQNYYFKNNITTRIIVKGTKLDHCGTRVVLNELVRKNCLTCMYVGRDKVYKLTPKGVELAHSANNFKKKLYSTLYGGENV